MKWRRKGAPVEAFEQRYRIIFAYVPRLCRDGYWRWLEMVRVEEIALDVHFVGLIWHTMGYEGK